MKKLLLIFLLAILPLQFSWAAAASYCQHEDAKPSHWGHHGHQHQAKAEEVKDAKEQVKKAQADNDCSVCHATAQPGTLAAHLAFPFLGSQATGSLPAVSYSSHIPDGPQKPNWRLFA